MTVIAFLDTNIFLHYQPVEQIDWLSVLEAEAVTLVVSPVVIRELDRLKDGPSGTKRAKERARRALSWLSELWSEELTAVVREGVTMEYHTNEPNIDFNAYGLSRDWNDDQLIATILAFRNKAPYEGLLLVTRDVGPRLKAQSHGVRTVRIPETYELQDEVDPAEQRIRELERELRETRNAIPQLGLRFQGSDNRKIIVLPAPKTELQPWLDHEIARARARFPKREYPTTRPASQKESFNSGTVADLLAQQGYNAPPREEIERYNNELDGFYSRYERYLRSVFDAETITSRSVTLTFELFNKGTSPAEEIELSLHFPDEFELLKADDLPKNLEPPQPPEPPRTRAQLAMGSLNLGLQIPYHTPPIPSFPSLGPPPNVSGARIRRAESYDVTFTIGRLKHHREVSFESLHVLFESHEQAHSFGIDYRILAANMPRETSGKLHVIINRS
jgi:hypothetical protein